ncbi:MAG TPA: acyltransferase domain-containing protein [Paucimonas sp.]|nr:acyltransferase domain-containing protein [Paucimonas sp.]
MSTKTVFMFSGQGSQYYQMGKQLYQENAVFRQWMDRLDKLAHEISGKHVVDAIYSGDKAQSFDRLLLTHPAIFMVEYSLAQCLIAEGIEPHLTLGASLGSFAAAAVAGCIDPVEAMSAVLEQAVAVESFCGPGGMIAIVADPALYEEDFLNRQSEMAGVNFNTHFVVSAPRGALAAIESALKEREVIHQRLAVAFPFHSRWIDAAREPVAAATHSIPIGKGKLPFACCAHAATLAHLPDDYFWRVVRDPIRFRDTVAHLERQGTHRYIDVGPSGTLATFVKYALPKTAESSAHAILTPYGQDLKNLAALLATA